MERIRYEELVENYQRLVYAICYQLTQNHHTTEDLTQETFLAVYLHMDSCPTENPKAWVSRIAVNKAKDYLKSAWCRRVQVPGGEALPETAGVLAAAEPQPEEQCLARETQEEIQRTIEALREPYGRVAALYFLRQESAGEIAARLERPKKTVQTQLCRAKGQLRAALCQPA